MRFDSPVQNDWYGELLAGVLLGDSDHVSPTLVQSLTSESTTLEMLGALSRNVDARLKFARVLLCERLATSLEISCGVDYDGRVMPVADQLRHLDVGGLCIGSVMNASLAVRDLARVDPAMIEVARRYFARAKEHLYTREWEMYARLDGAPVAP